jgi:competence protein ComFC
MKTILNLKSIKKNILDVFFPTECPNCHTKNEVFCDNCVDRIKLAPKNDNDNIWSLFDYHDPIIKNAIWELKYHHKRYLGQKLGQLLYDSFVEEISDLKTLSTGRSIYILPVPISKEKIKKRWYNQALYIAKGFCKSSDKEILELKNNIICKKTETIPQAKISSREKRLKNIQGVFQIKNEKIVKGRTIIIIDDVTTTGGTILEIMKILKITGAKEVIGLTVAH